MQQRYPYIRLLIGISRQLATAISLLILFGGLLRSCEVGGFSGFVSFLLTLLFAAGGYVATMVSIESLSVFLAIEENSQQALLALRGRNGKPEGDR